MKCWPHAELQRFIVSYTDYDRQDTIWTIFPAHMLVWTITIIPKHNLKVIRSMCAINATKVWKAAMDCSILHFIFMTVYISKLKMIFKKCVSVCVLQACNTQKHLKIQRKAKHGSLKGKNVTYQAVSDNCESLRCLPFMIRLQSPTAPHKAYIHIPTSICKIWKYGLFILVVRHIIGSPS